METRTSYILVGGFLLAAAAGLIGFVIWVVKADRTEGYQIYRTYFTGSVSGLSNTSDVRYRGIPIGRVTDIRIDPENVEHIRVTMEITEGTPIKQDSIAAVELQGITGVAYVQISGGSQASATLVAEPDRKYPVIRSQPSKLETLFSETPQLVDRVIVLAEEVTKLFDADNRAAVTETLASLRTLTGALAARSDAFARMIDDTSGAASALKETAVDIRGLTGDARKTLTNLDSNAGALFLAGRQTLNGVDQQVGAVGGDTRALLAELTTAAHTLNETTAELRAMIAENRKPVRDFAQEGLYDYARLAVEFRDLVGSLQRITERLESDPGGYLFGGTGKGYKAK
jgi:phospholipid/cholesterol/gamma-HCH transport system substrate-binding protein